MGGYYVYKEYFAEKEVVDESPIPTEEEEDASNIDVSEYTDIILTNYDGLEISYTDYSEIGDTHESGLISGIVEYKRYAPRFEAMTVVNKKVLSQEQIEEFYNPAYNDILNNNISAEWFRAGAEPWVLATTFSPGAFDPLIEIKGLVYPNTDHLFAVLALSHGQEYAPAGEEDGNYQIIVFAIKGDNLIRLESDRNNFVKDLSMSREDNNTCTEEIPDYYTSYNAECLSNIFKSGKYDEAIKEAAEDLVTSFEIAN